MYKASGAVWGPAVETGKCKRECDRQREEQNTIHQRIMGEYNERLHVFDAQSPEEIPLIGGPVQARGTWDATGNWALLKVSKASGWRWETFREPCSLLREKDLLLSPGH